nr:glycosyltransferase family 2 protein [uncultured Carboxylicivirga sp.]
MKLSVILLCYNQKEFIKQAIESILRQKVSFDYEVIVGDDCSTDGTSDIISTFSELHPQVKHFRHSENLGLIGNFVFCHRISKGKYVATLDGDDYWIDDTKLSQQVSLMDENDKLGLVHTQYHNYFMYPKFFGRRYVKNVLSDKLAKDNCSFEGIYSDYAIRSSTACYRRCIVEDSGLLEEFDKGYFSVEDWPVHLQCSLNWSVSYLKKSTAVYRVNKVSLSHFDNHEKRIEFLEGQKQIARYFAKKIPISLRANQKRKRSFDLSLAYYHYKVGDYIGFKYVYRQIKEKPISIRIMYLLLWLKTCGILKNEAILKR